MRQAVDVNVPDIGDFENVPVIEILVSPGDEINEEDPLVTLESDKATLDIPAPLGGTVKDLNIKVGDKVSQGALILSMLVADSAGNAPASDMKPGNGKTENSIDSDDFTIGGSDDSTAETDATTSPQSSTKSDIVTVNVPDIGDFDAVPIIEVMVQKGDQISAEQPLITLESDKASMEIPSPQAGEVMEINVNVGDNVSQGDVILQLRVISVSTTTISPEPSPKADAEVQAKQPSSNTASESSANQSASIQGATSNTPTMGTNRPSPTASLDTQEQKNIPHATPSIRRFSRELGVDLSQVVGTGRKGRILRDDLTRFVKQKMSATVETRGQGSGIDPIPVIDFAEFGPVETQPLSRIKKISGPHLQRSWLNLPHVTHNDLADVTELEAFRKSVKAEAEKQGVRVTSLAFITKAVCTAMLAFPDFNSSLSPDGSSLILKRYFNIGIAIDTPQGLVVPNIKSVNEKGIYDIAREMSILSEKARDGKLGPKDLKGGCFSISSLGGIGGTSFTPIVNAPEVAILGVNRAQMQPTWDGQQFIPRLMLPLSLSYDHRVIDGAQAARFCVYLSQLLSDVRRLVL